MNVTWISVDSDALDETRQVNAAVEQTMGAVPPLPQVGVDAIRRQRDAGSSVYPGAPPYALAHDRTITGPAGELSVRVAVPPDHRGVFLHIHGGGFALGHPHENDEYLRLVAERMHLAVVSVDYRLAPEHPHPAGPDDCEAAALWLIEHAVAEFGTDVLVIGGDSAGANLVATTLQRLRDRHGITGAFRAALFQYGFFDLGLSPSVRNWSGRKLVLDTEVVEWFAELYTAGLDRESRRHPDISPLYGDLRGMPPAFFAVGTLDPLLDDTLLMATRWDAAGTPATVHVYPESIHGFDSFPTRLAARALDDHVAFVAGA